MMKSTPLAFILLLLSGSLLGQPDKKNKSSEPKLSVGKNMLIKYANPKLPLVEPHIAVNPINNDHMVIAAMVYDSASVSDSRTHFAIFATKDNGKTWKQTSLDMKVAFDPWVSVKDNNKVMLVGLVGFENNYRNFLGYYTSSDGGLSWSKDVVNLGGGHDHPTLIIDHKHNDRLYLLSCLVKRNEAKQAINYVYLNYTDDWKAFQDSAVMFATGTNSMNNLTAAIYNGTVVMPYIQYSIVNNIPNTPSVNVVHADSAGFISGPFPVTEKLGTRKGFPVFAIDTIGSFKGRRYFVKNSGAAPARSQGLFLQYSEDGGKTWSGDIRIDHNEANEKFIRTAAIAVNKKGILGVTWVDRRNDSSLKKNDIYFTISTDGGKTFHQEVRVTAVNSDPMTAANGKAAERHISGGDYLGCVAKPDGSFQLVWADSRSGVFQLYTSNIKMQ